MGRIKCNVCKTMAALTGAVLHRRANSGLPANQILAEDEEYQSFKTEI